MINIKNSLTIMLIMSMIACNPSKKEAENNDKNVAIAQLLSKSNSNAVGVARFEQQADSVVMLLYLESATPGAHGVHIHENGDCSATDGNTAGRHWNPTNDSHGEWGSEHYHYGDIGNIMVDTLGNGEMVFTTDKWNLNKDDKFNILNKSIVVHSGTDDYIAQPSGNAGYKVACGVIELK
jgi:Cu-Zn family superoxide dismutase